MRNVVAGYIQPLSGSGHYASVSDESSAVSSTERTVRQSSQMLESDAAIFLKRAIVARMLKNKISGYEVLKDCLGDFFMNNVKNAPTWRDY